MEQRKKDEGHEKGEDGGCVDGDDVLAKRVGKLWVDDIARAVGENGKVSGGCGTSKVYSETDCPVSGKLCSRLDALAPTGLVS